MTEKASLTDGQLNERTLRSIKNHQRGLKALTGAAVGLWLVAMAGSVFVIWAYFALYVPKEKQILRDFGSASQAANTNAVPAASGVSEKDSVERHHLTFVMTRVVGMGMVATAACVAVLSAGMLATIILIVWNRRVTLRQINANLTQISAQLKELQPREGKP
jgi:hypothetical protein